MTQSVVIYLAIVGVLGVGLLVRALIYLQQTAKRRRALLEKRQRFDAIPTDSPVTDPASVARRRGMAAVKSHTTVTRRLLVPIIVGATALVAVLPFMGDVPTAFVSLMAAAITVIIGVAARNTVENAVAGLAISGSRMINIGDTVSVDEQYGTVEDITITHTTIKLWDWRRYVMPNRRLMENTLVNHSLYDLYEWVHVEFFVAYDADIDEVRELALEAATQSEHFADHEAPRFWVMEMGETALRCWVAAWADSPSKAWLLASDVRLKLKREFQARHIATHGYRVEGVAEAMLHGQ